MRTVYEFRGWYEIWMDWDNIRANLPFPTTFNMMFGLAVVTFWLTPYWTYKKTVQFFNPVDWNMQDAKDKKRKAN